ncbi:Nuclear localization sequence-binding protein [Colletotrichum chlorophyti]|uniref:Nuclear localization sequence-binding protein n=1 Tax=Colletotrichum chlorophyti TaxID=708187 RepID=A0A1Q8RW42_9PEZI|nr:Nuclear localization sequence-binding protein [Colletotrichum chlorophyti]
MGKTKSATKGSKAADPLTKVKNAGVIKASESPKAKSKQIAKDEEEEEESSSDSEAEDSSDSDSSDSEEEKPAKKAATKDVKKAAESSDSSDSDSSESEEEAPKAKTNGAAKEESSDSEEDSDDSDSDSSEDEKTEKKTEASSDSSDSDSDSDSDEEDSSDSKEASEPEAKAEEPSKKRKALDDPVIPGKKARTDVSDKSSTLFVGSLAWAVDDNVLYEAFQEFEGITGARVVTDKATGRSRGFGYVDFSTPEAAATALEASQGKELSGRAMNIDFSGQKPQGDGNPAARAFERAQKHGDTVSPESDTLFVGNLPFDVDQDTVRAFFSEVAEVASVRLPTDPESGNLKGFGYVSFNSIQDAKSAFEQLNGQYVGEGRSGRAVRLDYAGQKPQREGGGFGGRGGGRGGSRGGFGGRGGGRGGGGRGGRGGRGGFSSTNRGGFGDFKGSKVTF